MGFVGLTLLMGGADVSFFILNAPVTKHFILSLGLNDAGLIF